MAPSEWSKLTFVKFFTILADPEEKKPKDLSRSQVIDYTRQYQKKHFNRQV